MTYSILIKYNDSLTSFLSVKGRSEWKLRTARKHIKDVVNEQVNSDKWENVRYFAIVAV